MNGTGSDRVVMIPSRSLGRENSKHPDSKHNRRDRDHHERDIGDGFERGHYGEPVSTPNSASSAFHAATHTCDDSNSSKAFKNAMDHSPFGLLYWSVSVLKSFSRRPRSVSVIIDDVIAGVFSSTIESP